MRISPYMHITLPTTVILACLLAGGRTEAQTRSVPAYELTKAPIELELKSGARVTATVMEVRDDTVYLRTAERNDLRYPTSFIVHGLFDVPSQGTWRPRVDRREPWSTRILIDFNVARAEYGPDEPRGGVQVKVAYLKRFGEKTLVGPFAGLAAMRATYHETVLPVGVSTARQLFGRVGASADLGYGFGLKTSEEVSRARGGLHFHPRLTVTAAHPYNAFNVDFGFGYIFQRASFVRFQEERYFTEGITNPGIPGNVRLDVPYHRFSLSITCTIF